MLTSATSLTELISNPESYGLCSDITYLLVSLQFLSLTDLLILFKVPAKDNNTGTEGHW